MNKLGERTEFRGAKESDIWRGSVNDIKNKGKTY